MASFIGSDGACTLPSGYNATLNTWSATITRASADVTGFGGTIRNRRSSGVVDITGSAGGIPTAWDNAGSGSDGSYAPLPHSGTTLTNPAPGALLLTVAPNNGSGDSCSIAFVAVINSVAFSVTNDGDSTVSFNFEMSDSDGPTITWDES